MIFLHQSNALIRAFYPNCLWRIPTDEKVIYLTFDDGPNPKATPFALAQLANYEAKATFFCVGENLHKRPEIAQRTLAEGHTLGNHTYHHKSGWKTPLEEYQKEIEKTENILAHQFSAFGPQTLGTQSEVSHTHHSTFNTQHSPLYFRPPYGRMTQTQRREVQKTHQIVMWDVLTGDFSQALSAESILRKSIQYTRNGSIVVFHDSTKAFPHLQYVLPRYLAHFAKLGYRFEKL